LKWVKQAVEPLIESLSDQWPIHVIMMLGKIGDKRALEPIIHTIKNIEFSDVNLPIIAEVLGKFGDERAVEPLARMLQKRPEEYGNIITMNAARGKNVDWNRLRSDTAYMSSEARRDNQRMRIAAIQALGKIGGAKAAGVLMTAINDASDPAVQAKALQIWKSIQNTHIVEMQPKHKGVFGKPTERTDEQQEIDKAQSRDILGGELWNALRFNKAEKVKFLLEKDQSLANFRLSKAVNSPLHCAAEAGYVTIVQLLLAHGAEVDIKNGEGRTPLHYAASLGRTEVIKLLLDHGANINAADTRSDTILHYAVSGYADLYFAAPSVSLFKNESKQLEAVRLLLNSGANINTQGHEGLTALQKAEKRGHTKVAELLRRHEEPKKIAPASSIEISESPELWARKLKVKKDYHALAAINNSQDFSPQFQKWRKRDLANRILRDAGAEAVDAIMQELDTEGVGSYDLASLLVKIGDTRAVPLLKRKLDRGLFDSNAKSRIQWFIKKHQDLVGEVELVKCVLCGKVRPVTETQYIFDEGGKAKRFCSDTCWQKRGRVLKSGIGTDCPFYSEGICKAGDGDSLCSLQTGSYVSSCHVYAMYK
jgi:ankyrin repeat protein